jgi:AraC-like DNA-binding protein
MIFSYNFKSVSLLFFLLSGLIFTLLLLTNGIRHEQKSSKWLAAFILFCTLYVAPFMLGYSGWYSRQPYRDILFYVPFQQLFLLPPLLFFYVKNLLNNQYRFQREDWKHFLPAGFYFIYIVMVGVYDKLIIGEYYFYANERDKDFDLWYQLTGFVSMVYYLLLSLRLYDRYKRKNCETTSFADSVLYSWLLQFLVAFLLLLVIRLLFFILNPEWANFGGKYWYYLTFSMLYYFIALSGFTHAVKSGLQITYNQSSEYLTERNYDKVNDTEIVLNINQLSAEEERLKKQLEKLMSIDKLFRNPLLTLFDVAKIMNSTPKNISRIVNNGFDLNFNDFVNGYRIQDVIERVKASETDYKTLLGIALDAGFNSKSTFNRAFKKHINKTPKAYFDEK